MNDPILKHNTPGARALENLAHQLRGGPLGVAIAIHQVNNLESLPSAPSFKGAVNQLINLVKDMQLDKYEDQESAATVATIFDGLAALAHRFNR
jgi:hypothetical protein